MLLFLTLPLAVRVSLLFVVGAAVGTQLNRAIYAWAYDRREIGPWANRDKRAPPRRWFDYLPIFGWLGLAREANVHGPGFWIRPLLIELAAGLGCAALYVWELGGNSLPALPGVPAAELLRIHWEYVSHVLLGALMIVATFIDFDEQTIPDEITIPGTLAGLLLAACAPLSLLSTTVLVRGVPTVGTLLICSPEPWPAWLSGPWGLAAGLACFWGWCLAIVPSLWTTRHGLAKAMQYQVVSMARTMGMRPKHPLRRQPGQPLYVLLAALGGAGITATWFVGTENWQALLTALVGMAFSGGLIWGVRIVGSAALGKEAMGFGDVTLMAMIGAFVGWQASLLVFFLAPFAALFIALSQWLLTRRNDLAFGPYLCLAALVLIVRWRDFWHNWAVRYFELGWVIPALVVLCLVLMGVLLYGMQICKSKFLRE